MQVKNIKKHFSLNFSKAQNQLLDKICVWLCISKLETVNKN